MIWRRQKLSRNIDRDREDVVALATGPGLDTELLRHRYFAELRPKPGRPDREDLNRTLDGDHPGNSKAFEVTLT